MYILYTIKAKSLKLNVTTGMGWMLYLKFERLHTRWTRKKRRWWDGNLLDIFLILFFVLLYTFTRLLFACFHGDLSCLLPVACLLVTFLALLFDLLGLLARFVAFLQCQRACLYIGLFITRGPLWLFVMTVGFFSAIGSSGQTVQRLFVQSSFVWADHCNGN